MTDRDTESVLAEQIAYYEARAPEFDDWLERKGRYDYGPAANAQWHHDIVEVQDALVSAVFAGDALELACGTGNWTEVLARAASHVTAVDASSAMIAINRERLTKAGLADRVDYIQADLFTWRPARTYDATAVCFFLSHVPDDRVDTILSTVSAALRPGGRVFVADSKRAPSASTPDSPIPAPGEMLTRRRLNDGREYTIYKVFRTPNEFTTAFARHGIAFEGCETEEYFVFGFGTKQS